jgi:hypothetical protein
VCLDPLLLFRGLVSVSEQRVAARHQDVGRALAVDVVPVGPERKLRLGNGARAFTTPVAGFRLLEARRAESRNALQDLIDDGLAARSSP